jgi:hypothetical protein
MQAFADPPGRTAAGHNNGGSATNISGARRTASSGIEPRSPSREEEHNIRRGAQILRQQIQKQITDINDRLRGVASSPTSPPPQSGSSSSRRREQQPQQAVPASPDRLATERLLDGRSFGQGSDHYLFADASTEFSDPWMNQRADAAGRQRKLDRSQHSVEVAPPSADWSVEGFDLSSAYNLARTGSHATDEELHVPASNQLTGSRGIGSRSRGESRPRPDGDRSRVAQMAAANAVVAGCHRHPGPRPALERAREPAPPALPCTRAIASTAQIPPTTTSWR